MNKNNYLRGVFFCLIATLSWGAMFPVMTSALQKIDPFTFTALRYTLAGMIFLLFLYCKEGTAAFAINENKVLLWFFGSAGFAGFGFFVFLGQKLAGSEGALSASIMMATMPLLGLLVNWLFKGIRPAFYSFFFIGMSLLGVLMVITKGHLFLIYETPGNFVANIFMICGAFCWVVYTIGATYFPKWSPLKYTALSTLYGLPTIYGVTIILSFMGIIGFPTTNTIIQIFPELIYMSLVAGFIGVLCWNHGNKIITPLNGVLFMDIVPITAFALSTINGVIPTLGQIIGILCTVLALLFNNLFQRKWLVMQKPSPITSESRALRV